MKNGQTTYFNTGYRLLIVALWIGLASISSLQVRANSTVGKDNAVEGKVAVKRDPFWPVGHISRAAVESAAEKTETLKRGAINWEEAMKQVVINGVSSRAGNEYIAVINSEVKSVGESVSIWYGGTHYVWKVERITPPGSVKLRRHVAE